jgi:16S rRNA (guanine966-N2)-methyltransferase
LRIVGGVLSGRRFAGRPGEATRPTSERVREAIASAIESRGGFEGTRALDLYAGTGAMAFEALSRGAVHAVLVERDAKTARAIERAASELGIAERCAVITADLRTPGALGRIEEASEGAFDRVFVDPPYADIAQVGPLLARLAERALLAPGCILALEHAKKHPPELQDGLVVVSQREYGDTAVLLVTTADHEDTE